MYHFPRSRFIALCFTSIGLAPLATHAQFDPTRAYVESPAVARQFPAPDVRYPTPSLTTERNDFATHQEVFRFGEALAARTRHVRATMIGRTQQGRAIPMIVLARDGMVDGSLPTVMIVGQQHGDEPASGEAALAIADRLATDDVSLLERVNVVIVPRANPDAADMFRRASANGIDIDRDHLLLLTPEARAIADVLARFRPQVVLDLREFGVGGPWVQKLGAVERYDVMVQSAAVVNGDPEIARVGEADFAAALRAALTEQGFAVSAYYSTATDANDRILGSAGVQPDIGVNVFGLRPAVSLRVDVRGAGIGRAHLLRRVHVLAQAGMSVISIAAKAGPSLVATIDASNKRTAAAACSGSLAIDARTSTTKQSLKVLDAQSGEERVVEVEWRGVPPVEIVRTRARPCGYLIPDEERVALTKLQQLGVKVERVRAKSQWTVTQYAIASDENAQRIDARGATVDGAPIRALRVNPGRPQRFAAKGEWSYVPFDQPLAGLIAAALEPDSQNGFAANRVVDPKHVIRVTRKPAANALHPAPTGRPAIRAK